MDFQTPLENGMNNEYSYAVWVEWVFKRVHDRSENHDWLSSGAP